MESTTHQIFVTSKLRTKYPDYFTNSTNQKYVSILAVYLFKDDGNGENPDSAEDHFVDTTPPLAEQIMAEVGLDIENFATEFAPYKPLLEEAVTHPRLPETSVIAVENMGLNKKKLVFTTSQPLIAGSILKVTITNTPYFFILQEDGTFASNYKGTFTFKALTETEYELSLTTTMGITYDTTFLIWGFYVGSTLGGIDVQAVRGISQKPQETTPPEDTTPVADSTFSILQYCQLHADFVQDDECLEQYVCMANLPLYHKRKYKQYNNPRYFNVWFTDYKGTKIEINELDPKNPYHFVVELLLEY